MCTISWYYCKGVIKWAFNTLMTTTSTSETFWFPLKLLEGTESDIRAVSAIIMLMNAIFLSVLSSETCRSSSWAAIARASLHVYSILFSETNQVRRCYKVNLAFVGFFRISTLSSSLILPHNNCGRLLRIQCVIWKLFCMTSSPAVRNHS